MSPILSKINRWAARHTAQTTLPDLQQSIISFSFDDCPKSAITHGLPLLEAKGWRATIYVAYGLCGTTNHLGLHMSEDDIVETYERGHEIANHTYSHLSAHAVSPEAYLQDIDANRTALKALGLPTSQHFAYPFGHATPRVKKALQDKFQTLRGVISPKSPSQDANLLNAVRVYSNNSIDLALNEIAKAKTTPTWLHLFSHDVRDTPSKYGCTEADLEKIASAVDASGLPVMTVDKAYRRIMDEA